MRSDYRIRASCHNVWYIMRSLTSGLYQKDFKGSHGSVRRIQCGNATDNEKMLSLATRRAQKTKTTLNKKLLTGEKEKAHV